MISSSVTTNLLLFLIDAPFREDRIETVLGLFLAVAQRSRLLEILRFDRGLLVDADLLDLGLDVLHVRRPGHGRDAGARAGLVHDIDGLVRQEAPGEIAVGELGRGFERLVRNPRLVVGLVFRADSLEDQDASRRRSAPPP